MAREKKSSTTSACKQKGMARPAAVRKKARQADAAKLAREAMPSLCQTLIERGSEGDLAAIRLVWQMATAEKAKKTSATDARAQKRRDDLFARDTVNSILEGLGDDCGPQE